MSTLKLSVVVASAAGGEFVFRCLASLREQVRSSSTELIVVDRTGESTRERIRQAFPFVTVIAAPEDQVPTVPQMRRVGAEAASGEIVAILEEHCTAPSTWLDAIAANFLSTDVAIGGPILDNNYASPTDWCVYFSEYHNYMPPWLDGERYSLNGANTAYRREQLLTHRDVLDAGYWEVVLHPRLVKDGSFRAINAVGVHHTGPFAYGYYLRQRYLLSRVWGGTQKERSTLPTRLLHIAIGPVLPAFLFLRVTSRVLQRQRYIAPYLLTLPLLVPAWFCYAWGETLGYLVGPGRALEKVE